MPQQITNAFNGPCDWPYQYYTDAQITSSPLNISSATLTCSKTAVRPACCHSAGNVCGEGGCRLNLLLFADLLQGCLRQTHPPFAVQCVVCWQSLFVLTPGRLLLFKPLCCLQAQFYYATTDCSQAWPAIATVFNDQCLQNYTNLSGNSLEYFLQSVDALVLVACGSDGGECSLPLRPCLDSSACSLVQTLRESACRHVLCLLLMCQCVLRCLLGCTQAGWPPLCRSSSSR